MYVVTSCHSFLTLGDNELFTRVINFASLFYNNVKMKLVVSYAPLLILIFFAWKDFNVRSSQVEINVQ